MAEAPVTATPAPTPTAPNIPASGSIGPNPVFAGDPVYIDQLNKWNFQTEHMLAGDKETLANQMANYNRTLMGLEGSPGQPGKEEKAYGALRARNQRGFAGNSGFALEARQGLAGEFTQKRGALEARLQQGLNKIGASIQNREGAGLLAGAQYGLDAQRRKETAVAKTPNEAPPSIAAATNAAAATPGQGGVQGYPKATAYVNTVFPGGQAEQIAFSKMSPAQKQAWEAQHRAKGGPITPGHAYLVGEQGPELVVPKTPGRVVPNNRLAAIRKAAARGRYKR